jgi:hypothetical protein
LVREIIKDIDITFTEMETMKIANKRGPQPQSKSEVISKEHAIPLLATFPIHGATI